METMVTPEPAQVKIAQPTAVVIEAARQPTKKGVVDAQQTRTGAAFHQQVAGQRV